MYIFSCHVKLFLFIGPILGFLKSTKGQEYGKKNGSGEMTRVGGRAAGLSRI